MHNSLKWSVNKSTLICQEIIFRRFNVLLQTVTMNNEIERLRLEIQKKQNELTGMKNLLTEMERKTIDKVLIDNSFGSKLQEGEHRELRILNKAQIGRYSRQLILPELGIKGQQLLLSTQILIVGAGGLGCPAAIYLAAAGIGTLGIVDYDEIELSNLHRQILHTEQRLGLSKVESVSTSCKNINSSVQLIPYKIQLNSDNALTIIKQYDIILDATDNVATRYLLNDACVLAGKPLVSGSALRFEGQLTVYNYKGGPCYRCLYPKPPPPETVTNCSDGGVLGVVPGIIGCYQALEALKIAANIGTPLNQQLMLFDALNSSVRIIKLRPRQTSCPICGDSPSITHLINFEQFCGSKATDKDTEKSLLPITSRITAKEYKELLTSGCDHVLVDVRQPFEMDICQLPYPALNITMDALEKNPAGQLEKIKKFATNNSPCSASPKGEPAASAKENVIIVVCRRGNDSQIAVKLLQNTDPSLNIKDIQGGLHAWACDIDPNFPVY